MSTAAKTAGRVALVETSGNGRRRSPAWPPPGTLGETRLDVVRSVVVLAIVCGYMLLNWPFQQFRIPPGSGLPIGDVTLILALATINHNRSLGRLSSVIPLFPFIAWWTVGFSRMLFDFTVHGVWALRDAAQVVESLYLLVGFVLVATPGGMERFFRWLPVLIAVGTVYGLLYPLKDAIEALSPTVPSGSGYPIPIFGSMVNTPYLMTMGAAYLFIFRGNRLWANFGAVVIIGGMVALFQARTIYLILIAVFAFLVWYRRSHLSNLTFLFYVAGLLLAAVPLFGIEFEGRLGASVSLGFLVDHFLAIFGIASDSYQEIGGAAAGVDLRLGWWQKLIEDLLSDPFKLLLGLGYGIPLTDFEIATGAIVREPHNSYVSIFARTGAAGLAAWVAMMSCLLLCWHRAFKRCRAIGWRLGENRLMLLMVFFICIWVLAIGEDGFEKPFNIIPFYVFFGVVLRMAYMLRCGMIGPAIPEAVQADRGVPVTRENDPRCANALAAPATSSPTPKAE